MLECGGVELFWKMVSRIVCHFCGLGMEMDEKILLIGFEIDNSEFYLTNLMVIFAGYVIYRNHVQRLQRGTRVNAKGLFYEMKSELRFYLNSKVKMSIHRERIESFLDMLHV